MAKIKNLFKKLFPASAKTSEKYTNNLLWKLDKLNDRLDELETISTRLAILEKSEQDINARLERIEETNDLILHSLEFGTPLLDLAKSTSEAVTKIDETLSRVEAISSDSKKEIGSVEAKVLDSVIKVDDKIADASSALEKVLDNQSGLMDKSELILDRAEKTHERAVKAVGNSQEAVWAHVFHDTIKNSEWLKDTRFSPGRWAVGYPYLYVLYRILNEVKPKSILDIGLGQTTKMIMQYAQAFDDVEHTVIEDNESWIKFFVNSTQIPSATNIKLLKTALKDFNSATGVRMYDNFKELLEGKRYDLISIDAPASGDMKEYARVDILPLLPNCLTDDFIILVHDTERFTENKTVQLIEEKLQSKNIDYKKGQYYGQNSTTLLCSLNLGFLASL